MKDPYKDWKTWFNMSKTKNPSNSADRFQGMVPLLQLFVHTLVIINMPFYFFIVHYFFLFWEGSALQ